jgi:hypothetical protein
MAMSLTGAVAATRFAQRDVSVALARKPALAAMSVVTLMMLAFVRLPGEAAYLFPPCRSP